MVKKKKLRCWITGLLLGGAMAMPAAAQEADVAALRAELTQMRAEITALKANRAATWMDDARQAELKTLVEGIMADAGTRGSLGQGGGVSAGHNGKKFFLKGDDFLMNIGGQLQFRYINNNNDGRTGSAQSLDGFEFRRAKLKFKGHIGDPKIGYAFTLASSRSSANTTLESAELSYKFDNGWKLKAGRMKLPFLFEELLSSSRQLALDRGLSTEFFTLNYSEQLQLQIPIEDVAKVYLAYSDGANTGSSNATADTADYAFTARVQTRLAGDWKQAKDMIALEDDFAAFAGGAIHWEQTEGVGNDELLAWTIDGLVKTGNLTVMAAVMAASADADNRDQFGVLAQAGYSLDKQWQPFIRWDFIDPDDTDELNAFTAGVNYFLQKHNAKFTTDVVWIMEPENPGALAGLNGGEFSSGLGLSSAGLNGSDDQVVFRSQFQLLF